jgi:hypothetical protein
MSDHPNRNAKTKHFLLSIVDTLFNDGVGKSKHVIFQLNYEAQRKRISTSIHSYSTATSYKKVVAKFADFLKEQGLKYERDFKKLTTEQLFTYVDRYFEKQKEQLAKKTLQKHISALNKVLSVVDPKISEYFNAENRAKWRDGKEPGDNDRYGNPERIVEHLKHINETAYVVAELQRLTGCRVGDVKKLMVNEEHKAVFIHRSKGGRDRAVYYEHFPHEFERVKELKEKLDKVLQEKPFREIREKEYYQALRKSCKMAGEPYHGSHPFRYEFSQNRFNVISQLPKPEQEQYYIMILKERGKSAKDINKALENAREKDAVCEYIISEELGHSRLDISRHYLKIRAK